MPCLHSVFSELRSDGVFFLRRHRRRGGAMQEEVAAILHVPFDGLALLQAQATGQGGGDGDVPLLAGLTPDELDFGGVTHGTPFVN
jgi:hypothetical protein